MLAAPAPFWDHGKAVYQDYHDFWGGGSRANSLARQPSGRTGSIAVGQPFGVVGLRTFRRGGTGDAKDGGAHPTKVDIHCRWRIRGVTMQDLYDPRSIRRRMEVTRGMLAHFSLK